MEPDAEHEQDDSELGELGREPSVGDKARCERPYGDACQKGAKDRGQAESAGEKTENESEPEAGGDRGDKGGFVRHRAGAE